MTLVAQDLVLAYARDPVVDGVSLQVANAEFVALLGPNGAGKSALLRSFARLLRPRSGHILLDGADLWSLSPRHAAREIAWVSSTTEAPRDLTVRDLLRRARYPHQGLLGGEPGAAAAIDWALRACTLSQLVNRRLDALSAGEKQRASIAAGLAQQPSILLLDEPTAFLDLQHALETMELLRELNRDRGLTVIAALHDLTQAARYCTRAIVLRQGRVAADGPLDTVLVPDVIRPVFGVDLSLLTDPVTGRPVAVPHLPAGMHLPAASIAPSG